MEVYRIRKNEYSPQVKAKNALKELGISDDIVERMVAAMLPSSSISDPVEDQPASEGSESQANHRPGTPPPQPEPVPMGAQVEMMMMVMMMMMMMTGAPLSVVRVFTAPGCPLE